MSQESPKRREIRAARQVIGRRIEASPYYEIASAPSTALVLRSRAGANDAFGRAIIVGAAVRLAIAALILVLAAFAAGREAGFGPVVVLTVAAAWLGGNGARRLVGGLAVQSTTNELAITDDAVIWRQFDRFTGERFQQLPRSAIRAVGVTARNVIVDRGGAPRRMALMALEIQTETEPWFVDSAESKEPLEATAAALAAALGVARVDND